MADNSATINEFIENFSEACLETPLYGRVTVPPVEGHPVDRLFERYLQFDGYCIHCQRQSVFRVHETLAAENGANISSTGFPDRELTFFKSSFYCTRDVNHVYVYFWHYIAKTIIKVGQSPSLESIAGNDVQQYKKVLGNEYFSELHRATGLASHGIGIGSFVYLRRIFERLIQDHREIVEAKSGALEGFDALRMSEKIEVLKSELPEAVVKYRLAYGILSKGIHELSENECKQYFPILRSAIISILEQDLQNKLKREKEDALEKEMQRIMGELGKPVTS